APFDVAAPKTPGPDDDYRVTFPKTDATWSDLVMVGGTLFAALGTSAGRNVNGVYRTNNPTSNNPTWFVGDASAVDARSANEFPVADYTNYPPTALTLNGNIKLAV